MKRDMLKVDAMKANLRLTEVEVRVWVACPSRRRRDRDVHDRLVSKDSLSTLPLMTRSLRRPLVLRTVKRMPVRLRQIG
jgi:hypothetical protein